MKPRIVFAFLLGCCVAAGQQTSGALTFEAASIKRSEPMPMGQMRIGMGVDGTMLRYTNVSLRDCIRVAYRLKDFQVQGPDWLGGERFDIVATIPAGAKQDQVPDMLQALLAERFKLKVHRDSKEHAIFALVPAKGGPKLKAAEVQTAEAAPSNAPPRPPGAPRGNVTMMMGPEGAHLKAPSATLANLAEMMSRFSERPIVDMTGIQGQYDFELVFSPDTMRNMPGGGRGPMGPPPGGAGGEHQPGDAPSERAGSIHESVKPYGLKLEPRKAPMEILVVDHIEKTPTEN